MAQTVKQSEKVAANVLIKRYRVTTDGIIVGQDAGIRTISGIITREDVEGAGADFEWLINSGQLEEVGYA